MFSSDEIGRFHEGDVDQDCQRLLGAHFDSTDPDTFSGWTFWKRLCNNGNAKTMPFTKTEDAQRHVMWAFREWFACVMCEELYHTAETGDSSIPYAAHPLDPFLMLR
jgi:hypothetical protein